MYTMLTNRRDDKDRDEGFTLIELMVVVLIIAILLAIAIPTFLGAQSKAKDRGAQSSVKIALTTAKTVYADDGDYEGATVAKLAAIEPSVKFLAAAPSTGSKEISLLADTALVPKVWHAAVKSDTGTCYYVRDSIDTTTGGVAPGTMYAKNDVSPCTATPSPTGVAYATDGWETDTVVPAG